MRLVREADARPLVNYAPYYRCRFPAKYALVNHVEHPLSVFLREVVVIGEVDDWLEAVTKIAEWDRRLAQYRAALDAGASPATVAAWIAEASGTPAAGRPGLRG